MKATRKIIVGWVLAGMLFTAGSGLAQTILTGPSSFTDVTLSPGTPVQPVSGDSIVQITAEAQGLPLLSPDQAQFHGGMFCYWWVMPGGAYVPMPFLPQDASAVFLMADNQFLVDESGGQIIANTRRPGGPPTRAMLASTLATQADWLVGLITQVQANAVNQQMRMLARSLGMGDPSPFPGGDGFGDGGGGVYTNNIYSNYSFDHTQLWLEFTNVNMPAGWTGLNLHNATNLVYAIKSTPNVATPCAGWQVETEVWPTDTNCMTFSLATLDRQNLFLRAEDWTGVDSDGDGIPDWWAWKYFGMINVTGTNLDNGGVNTLLEDYTNNWVPNVFSFTGIEVTNNYFNVSPAAGQLDVSGNPYYIATLVDDTNFADAVWNSYSSSNITVNLGTTEAGMRSGLVCAVMRTMPAPPSGSENG
jgi:hypothetical protein